MPVSKPKPPALVMVGTVHRDPRAFVKLFRLLTTENSPFITVEISPFAHSFRARHGQAIRASLRENLRRIAKEGRRPLREILGHPAILGIFLLLREPYEWRAAQMFGLHRGSTLRDIDLSSYSAEKLSHLSELIEIDNLNLLLRNSTSSLQEEVEAQYRRARYLFSHPPSIGEMLRGIEMSEREFHMAAEIRKVINGANGKKVLHIGGWEHLVEYPGEGSLFGMLKDFQPRRILLSSVEN
jgi:hypothetical protein